MRKHAVGGKIVGRVHEVRLRRGRFARAAHAALRVGHDAVLEIDEARSHQRLQRQNDRRRIAAGIGDQLRAGNLLAMQLRHAVDGLGLRGRGQLGAFVREGIDGAVGRFGQPPGAAQVDDAQSALERFGNPLARLLVRRGEKQNFDAALGQQIPGKRLSSFRCAAAVVVRQLRDESRSSGTPPRARSFASTRPAKTGGLPFEARMMQQQPRQLRACVARDSHNRGLNFLAS